ncbi:Absent in melanoma 1-like protein [Acipenser ruthenus]|uniref:Absent in melanoma 1-like protein n=1 Tax=Acipenser ruthenus TaxID=7906 RepID=A0A662YMN8_ACIRT|nr:Absent in melanoma 1-like protein [Acipenser ruthenus]
MRGGDSGVTHEKEGFRGHQYLLEEGEFHDWRVWGGCNSELRSLHLIRADFTEPEMIMYECTEEGQEGHSLDVLEAIPDLELVEYGIMTQSIHVLNGAWIAYSNVDYSGSQYILEKGFYNSYQDWGGSDSQISSVQPIRLIQLFSEPEFRGSCLLYEDDHTAIPEAFQPQSCRVMGGSWVVYEGREYSGNLYVLGQGEYPNFATMGCPPKISIRSVKMVPLVFTEPSISLYSLECFEGREIRLDSEVQSLLSEGFNNHVLSVRVSGGVWVVCEHSNYRGRQILLETIEITNWLKFSEFNKIGSLYPVRQKRVFFHLKHRESGQYMAIQAGLEDMKSGRVVVTEQLEGMSHVWFYQDGLIKNKLAPELSLQVMGKPDNAAKVVLWSETRQPRQSWRVQPDGHILSQAFEGMTLDVKGGKTYDRDHVVVWTVSEERPSQHWDMESL